MSRVSSVVLGAFVAILATTAGCKVSVETKTRYTENDVPAIDSQGQDWNGEAIKIDIPGVGIAVNGGVNVTSDPNATKVTALARVLATAFPEHKADADLTLIDVKAGFTITRDGSGTIVVSCPHGATHGDSASGESGCEKVNIIVPAGTPDKKLRITALSGNAGLELQLSNATIGSVDANSKGGGINADLPATVGGTVSLFCPEADDVTINLPSTFAADRVEFVADQGKVGLGPFTDITAFNGTTGRGAAGTGLASLKATSGNFAGSTGNIDLQAR